MVALTAILFFPFGLFPLIKGTMIILCAAVTGIAFAFFLCNQRLGQAISVVTSPVLSILFFWGMSGQSTLDLPNYFISIAPIITGYTEAMAIDGNLHELLLFIIAVGVTLYGITSENSLTRKNKIFLGLLFSCVFFLAFKTGFVSMMMSTC
jgi:hypothetical protein